MGWVGQGAPAGPVQAWAGATVNPPPHPMCRQRTCERGPGMAACVGRSLPCPTEGRAWGQESRGWHSAWGGLGSRSAAMSKVQSLAHAVFQTAGNVHVQRRTALFGARKGSLPRQPCAPGRTQVPALEDLQNSCMSLGCGAMRRLCAVMPPLPSQPWSFWCWVGQLGGRVSLGSFLATDFPPTPVA